MNKNSLRSIIALHGHTQASLAKHLGISAAYLSEKLNGSDGADFKRSEIAKIKDYYNLTDKQVSEIFFNKEDVK